MNVRRLSSIILLALALLTAGVASARAEPRFEADSYAATIDGVAKTATVFQFGGIYKWECKAAPMQAKLSGESSALTLSASYGECRWQYPPGAPFSLVQIFMNGCDYRLHALQRVKTDEYLSQVDLECPENKEVVIELHQETPTICKLKVPAQSNKSHVALIDETGKEGTADDDVKAKITVAKMKYTLESFVGCPVSKGTYEDLEYLGESTLTATSEAGKQIGFRVAGE